MNASNTERKRAAFLIIGFRSFVKYLCHSLSTVDTMICEPLRRVRNDPRFHWGPPYKRASSLTHFVMLRPKGHYRTIP